MPCICMVLPQKPRRREGVSPQDRAIPCSVIADKTDVYSFGVVMLELVTGMPAVSQDLTPPQLCLRVKDFIKGATDTFINPKKTETHVKSEGGHARGPGANLTAGQSQVCLSGRNAFAICPLQVLC